MYDKVCHHLEAWIYSWMIVRVETNLKTLGVAFIESVLHTTFEQIWL